MDENKTVSSSYTVSWQELKVLVTNHTPTQEPKALITNYTPTQSHSYIIISPQLHTTSDMTKSSVKSGDTCDHC